MKLTLAIIVFIGLYTGVANPPGISAVNIFSYGLDKKYKQFLEKAEKYAVSPEMNPAYNLRTLTWAKSDFANEDFKSKCIQAFKKRAPADNEAAYDILTEKITNLFVCVDGTSQPKRVNSDTDDSELTICPICLDSVTSDGKHRIVVTKCGHIFGEFCLELWLSNCPDGSKTCPTCKQTVDSSDIWKLYNSEILVVENKFQEERDELHEELKALKQGMELLKESRSARRCPLCNFSSGDERGLIQHVINVHRAELLNQMADLLRQSRTILIDYE